MRIRRDDMVVLTKSITGARGVDGRALGKESPGSVARVLSVNHVRGRVIVEGVNYRYSHERRTHQNPRGGRVAREAAIHVSNVMLYCPKCDRGVRVRRNVVEKTDARGRRRREVVRVCRRCGESLGGGR